MLARFRGSKNLKTSVNYLSPTYSGQNTHNSFPNKKIGFFGSTRSYSDRKDKDDDEKEYDKEDKKEKKISYDDYLYSNNTLPWKAAQFVDQTVRGVGQLTFVENTIGGVGLIGALSYFSPITALSVVVGSALSVFWANVIRADKDLIKSGLICFNGILVVAGTPFFIQPIVPVITIAIFGSLLATFMFDRACKHLSFPVLTLPFVITECLALLLTKLNIGVEPTFDFSLAPTPTFAHVTSDQLVPLLYKLAEAIPLSITQLCFTKDPTILFGAFFISLLVYLDKRIAASAIGGAIIGCTTGVLIGMIIASYKYNYRIKKRAL
jgi:urea transporter